MEKNQQSAQGQVLIRVLSPGITFTLRFVRSLTNSSFLVASAIPVSYSRSLRDPRDDRYKKTAIAVATVSRVLSSVNVFSVVRACHGISFSRAQRMSEGGLVLFSLF